MLTTPELITLAQRQDGLRTLSVYLPLSADLPAPRAAARMMLRNGLARVRERLAFASHVERTVFEGCAARLSARADTAVHAQGGGTWVAFAFADGSLYEETLPALLPQVVAWEDRARIAPYIAAVDLRHALVVVSDAERAALYRATGTSTHELERFETRPEVVTGSHMSAPPRVGFHAGTRGTSGADAAQRQAEHAHQQHEHAVSARLRAVHERAEWLVLAGASETVAHLVRDLPADLRERTVVAHGITAHSTPAELRAGVDAALGEVRHARQATVVDAVVDGSGGPGCGALGAESVGGALTLKAVATLVLSAGWVDAHPIEAEEFVRRALAQHAAIEIVAGDAGDRLDALANGAAAVLRYAAAGLTTVRASA